MLLLKKIFLGFTALALIFIGGSGTQSSSILLQGGGFVGLIVGFVVLYIFGKLVWRAMGCLPSFLIIAGIVGFLLYAIGAFNGGVQNVIPNLQKFIGTHGSRSEGSVPHGDALQLVDEEVLSPAPVLSENFSDIQIPAQNSSTPAASASEPMSAPVPEPRGSASRQPARMPEKESDGGIMGFVNNLLGGSGETVSQPRNFNPADYPAVYGSVQVVSADTLLMRNHYITLYGIDGPEINQNCANSRGRAYACGKEAARWLQGWILDNEIECRVLKQNAQNKVTATCSYGQYDIGAALVSAGWAVSLPGNGIYQPYELQAQKAQRGMWQGQFYKPWDWREIQSKKPKIKIIKPKSQKRLWDYL